MHIMPEPKAQPQTLTLCRVVAFLVQPLISDRSDRVSHSSLRPASPCVLNENLKDRTQPNEVLHQNIR
jgi:hypothetical protein